MKKFWIFFIILVIIIALFLYWWFTLKPYEEESQPPTLFNKEDYKIEEKNGDKFIVINKVGLTCKVPDEWNIEFEGSDIPEPEYWVNLSSPDAEIFDILIKGCAIGIIAQISKNTFKELEDKIKIIEENPENSGQIKKNYTFEIIEINNKKALKWLSPEEPIMGQAAGLDILIKNNKIISLDTRFIDTYKNKCFPIWEEFLKNVTIK